MRRHRIASGVLFVVLYASSLATVTPGASGGRVIAFPEPPHPDAIGTAVGAINTAVRAVTLSPPASIHRLGLVYSEIRGTISGVGWGGQPVTLGCHPGDVRARVADVNHDGRPDLLLEFRLDRLRLDPTNIVVDLWGMTRGGGTFAGSDLVRIAADQVRK